MEVFLIRALQLILCFSILILFHEGGHFVFAKLFKVRVEKFCLFFDPWFSLKLFRWRGTDYHLGWLPLGGYVKIAGMIDESMDTEQMQQPVQPWEFRAKPAWQRLLIMIAGVLVNFLLALFIYAMILFTWGDRYVPVQHMTDGFKFNASAQQLGFRDGDIPLRTDAAAFDRFDSNESIGSMYRELSTAKQVTVLRDGREVTFSLPGDMNMLDMLKADPPFATILQVSEIDSVGPDTPASRAGLQAGDRIVGFNGTRISTWNEYQELRGRMNDVLATASHADSVRLRTATLWVERGTATKRGNTDAAAATSGATAAAADMTAAAAVDTAVCGKRAAAAPVDTLTIQLDANYNLGAYWYSPMRDYATVTKTYGFWESFPAGCRHGWNVLAGYVSDLKYLFTADGAKSVGSFGAIGSLFPAVWDWQRFWELTAFISLMLAFMNILPIPALDGGHAFFLLCEVITRRKPSDKFMERAQIVGMTLLLLLMSYAIFNDVWNFLLKGLFS